MSILILDFLHEDPGLKILFKDAEYYAFARNANNMTLYPNIVPSLEIEKLEFAAARANAAPPPAALPTLMVIAPLFQCCYMWRSPTDGTPIENSHFKRTLYEYFSIFIHLIKNYHFENVLFFDTHAYQYDPNTVFNFYRLEPLAKKIAFFKRNYANNIEYGENVFPFPYIGNGPGECVIDLLQKFIKRRKQGKYQLPDKNRLFFAGIPKCTNDPRYGTVTESIQKLQKIKNTVGEYLVYRERMPDDDAYYIELARSNFCLSITEECGAPTRRMFDILSSGSLLMCEADPNARFLWNFGGVDGAEFMKETIFENENDLFAKLNLLGGNLRNYYICLERQNVLVDTYMNKTALRKYIKFCADCVHKKYAPAAPPAPMQEEPKYLVKLSDNCTST